jgi:predicted ester cyclase
MAFYRLADGQIVEERAQLDMLGILQQFGAAPAA